jgi:membrane associated rhomboid family serine protease
MVAGYGFLMWDVAQWFMALPDPNSQQASFVSVMVGASAAIFGLYTNSGPRND